MPASFRTSSQIPEKLNSTCLLPSGNTFFITAVKRSGINSTSAPALSLLPGLQMTSSL